MTSEHAGGGGSAGRPTIASGGPPPVPPDDLAELLPKGFELPEGVHLVYAPPPTPEQQVAGNVEHASMLRGLHDAAVADWEAAQAADAEARAAKEAAVAQMGADADAAEQRARDVAAEHGIEIGGGIPPHPLFAHLYDSDGGAA